MNLEAVTEPRHINNPAKEWAYFNRGITAEQMGSIILGPITGQNITSSTYPDFEDDPLDVNIDYWESSLAKAAVDLHDGVNRKDEHGSPIENANTPPKVIFITLQRGSIFVPAFREFWKAAYPREKPPIFRGIDVSDKRFLYRTAGDIRTNIRNQELERLQRLGRRLDAFGNVAVFDEYKWQGRTLIRSAELLRDAGYHNVNFMHGAWCQNLPVQYAPVLRYSKYDLDEPQSIGSMGRIARPLVNKHKRSLALQKDMATIGALMAEEARRRGLA